MKTCSKIVKKGIDCDVCKEEWGNIYMPMPPSGTEIVLSYPGAVYGSFLDGKKRLVMR